MQICVTLSTFRAITVVRNIRCLYWLQKRNQSHYLSVRFAAMIWIISSLEWRTLTDQCAFAMSMPMTLLLQDDFLEEISLISWCILKICIWISSLNKTVEVSLKFMNISQFKVAAMFTLVRLSIVDLQNCDCNVYFKLLMSYFTNKWEKFFV